MDVDFKVLSNIWIINKKNSLCVLQRNYGEENKIDKDLFSGFTTAFFNFSEEISGEHIKSVTMGSFKFFYKNTESMILTISADANLLEEDVSPVMEEILTNFINEGFEKKITSGGINENLFLPFIKTLDKIVENAEDDLQQKILQADSQPKIIRSNQAAVQKKVTKLLEAVKFEKPKTLTDQEAKDFKDKIMEILENAEYAINYSEFKEASIYYGVVAGLFDELGDYEKAEHFRQFAEKLKEMAIYKEELIMKEAEEKITMESKPKIVIPIEMKPIIDIESIQENKIKDIMNKAFEAEISKRYQEAITYYNSAAGLFLIHKMTKYADKCSEKIKALVKKQQLDDESEPYTISINERNIEITQNQSESQIHTPEQSDLILLIPEESISDEGIKNLLKNAAIAENLELIDKAINFYSEACDKFKAYKQSGNEAICLKKINYLKKKFLDEDKVELKGQGENKEELLIPEHKILDEEIKNLLKNAALAEKLELFDKALKFYKEAANKFVELKDHRNEIICNRKISELEKKLKIAQRLEKFTPIIPLDSIEDIKIKRNLERAYEAEMNKKFKQASLFYNIATSLFSAKNDLKNAELCANIAKKLRDLS